MTKLPNKDTIKELTKIAWKLVLVPLLYVVVMWSLLVVAVYLFLKDFLQSAGLVSAVILFHIVKAEFYKEFFGSRNQEQVLTNGIQKQKKG